MKGIVQYMSAQTCTGLISGWIDATITRTGLRITLQFFEGTRRVRGSHRTGGEGGPTGPGGGGSHRTGEGRSHRTPKPLDTNHYLNHEELTITPNSSNLGQKAHPIYAAKTSDEALDAIADTNEDRRHAQRLIETNNAMRELKATHDHLQRGSDPSLAFPSSFGSFAGVALQHPPQGRFN